MTKLDDIKSLFTDGTLMRKLEQCRKMMYAVMDEETAETLDLEGLIPWHTSEITIDINGVNGIPWEMLEGSEGDMALKWRAVYWKRARDIMRGRVADNEKLMADFMERVGPDAQNDPVYLDYLPIYKRNAAYLGRCIKNDEYYSARTSGFDL